MLPIGGLLIVIFAGWIIKEERLSMQLDKSKGFCFKLWLFLSKYIVPAAVLIIFVRSIGILSL
jgi:NSS family neurotransmitter:Na+ symporter